MAAKAVLAMDARRCNGSVYDVLCSVILALLLLLAPGHEGQTLKQVNILLVFQQGAM